MNFKTVLLITIICSSQSCAAQTEKNMKQQTNPLLCDIETGICEVHNEAHAAGGHGLKAEKKPVTLIYFTDPICSSCWGIEPQLRRLKLEYGDNINIEYYMGGLLPDWSYNSGGISKPSDVAHHWDEVSQYYKMPIDGDVWLEDPLNSSFPPSIAFKAAQLQDEHKAIDFLRQIREMVFLQKKNITRWEHIEAAAQKAGLNTLQLKSDYEGKAKELFEKDLEMARKMGVRGFPTIFIADTAGNTETVYGSKPYSAYVNGITKQYPQATKKEYATDWEFLFGQYPTLTTREYAELADISYESAEVLLKKLVNNHKLGTINTKNGVLWMKQ